MNLDEIERNATLFVFFRRKQRKKYRGGLKGLGKSLKNYRDETKRRAKGNMVDVEPNPDEKSQRSVPDFLIIPPNYTGGFSAFGC
jgi:hypothetical protein